MPEQRNRFTRRPPHWVSATIILLFLMGMGLFAPLLNGLWPNTVAFGMHLGPMSVVVGILGLAFGPMLVATVSDWRHRRRTETGVGVDSGSDVRGANRPTTR